MFHVDGVDVGAGNDTDDVGGDLSKAIGQSHIGCCILIQYPTVQRSSLSVDIGVNVVQNDYPLGKKVFCFDDLIKCL